MVQIRSLQLYVRCIADDSFIELWVFNQDFTMLEAKMGSESRTESTHWKLPHRCLLLS